MADNVVFFPLDITYRIENNKAIIHLFVRTNDNKQICVIDENFDAATGGVGDGDLILVSNLEATVGCKSDRSFARQIDRLVAPDSNILVVDNPALAFMLKSKNVWQHVRISPHLETSVDLLKREQYPTYIVGGPWSEDVYLKSYMNLSNKYNIVVTEGRYSLYRLRAD